MRISYLQKNGRLAWRASAMAAVAWLALLGAYPSHPTASFYGDTAAAGDNAFAGAVLDLRLDPSEPIEASIRPGEGLARVYAAGNGGAAPLVYRAEAAVAGPDTLCGRIRVAADRNGEKAFSGRLADFMLAAALLGTTTADRLEFYFYLPAAGEPAAGSCDFRFNFYAWTPGGEDYDPETNFTDLETITGRLVYGPVGVLINEFLPDPVGPDNAPMPGGEWVELYNTTDTDIDAAGWMLYDAKYSHELPVTPANTDTGGTIVPAGGWLVVYRDGDRDFSLNNNGDTVRLFSGRIGTGVLIDRHTYSEAKPAGFSHARIPDGSDNWVDPVPTPGGPNRLAPDEDGVPAVSAAPAGPEVMGENGPLNTDDPVGADGTVNNGEATGGTAPEENVGTGADTSPAGPGREETGPDDGFLPEENNGGEDDDSGTEPDGRTRADSGEAAGPGTDGNIEAGQAVGGEEDIDNPENREEEAPKEAPKEPAPQNPPVNSGGEAAGGQGAGEGESI